MFSIYVDNALTKETEYISMTSLDGSATDSTGTGTCSSPRRLMWGNGVTWALMITILTNPRKKGQQVSHCVKKFVVLEYILELLEGLPITTGLGIKGDVLVIEDTFSLLAG